MARWRAAIAKPGSRHAGVIADLAEYGLYHSDKPYLEQMLNVVSNDPDVAYATVFDRNGRVLVERRFAPGLAKDDLPPLDLKLSLAPGRVTNRDAMIGGKRYIELIAPSATRRARATPASRDGAAPRADGVPNGYLRVGMSQDAAAPFRDQMVGAIAVALALLVFAISPRCC